MYYNMKEFTEQLMTSPKKPLPILSFPAVQLLGISVRELISSADAQAKAMYSVAQKVPSAASVSLMDLSVEAECFGAKIVVSDNEVPTVKGKVISEPEEAEALKVPQVGTARSGIFIDAIRKAGELITDRPILAGVIGPFSLAARLTDVTDAMIYCYDEPKMMHVLLQKATEFIINYCLAYKEAGANGVVMAEPVAGVLSPSFAAEFSSPYVKAIVDAVQDDSFAVIYHNCGNNVISMVDSILSTGCAAYHFGNAIKMDEMLSHLPHDTIAMGNIDPVQQFCDGTPQSIRQATLQLMENCSSYNNFVLSSGCDIPPRSPWENIEAFFAAAEEFYSGSKF